MSKFTPPKFNSLQNESSFLGQLNSVMDSLKSSFDKTLSRDGATPNQMGADLDMNSNHIVNMAKGTQAGHALEFTQLQDTLDEIDADIQYIDGQVVIATAQANRAESEANSAEGSANSAAADLATMEALLETYNNSFLGTFASNPTHDNSGNPLDVGDLYYNSVNHALMVYDGTDWQDVAAMTPTSYNTVYNKIYADAVFRGTFTPETNDGTALGTSALKFSDLFLASGAVINFNSGDVTITHSTDTLSFAGAASGYNFDNRVYRDSNFYFDLGSNPYINFDADDYLSYARATNLYNFVIGGSNELVLSSTNLMPGSNDGNALGSSSFSWADLFLASGAVINFNNGNYTITHSSGLLNFSGSGQYGDTLYVNGGYASAYSGGSAALKLGGGGSSPDGAAIGWGDGSGWKLNLGYNNSSTFTPRYTFTDTGAFYPSTNDGAVLGTASFNWSDLFLATGAVINFNNSNYTLTHSTGILTASGDIRISSPGTNSASVVTVGGTQTLTNKSLTAPVISSIVNTGTLTLPTSTDTLVGRATSDTLTNKTLTNPLVGTQSTRDNSTKAASTAYADAQVDQATLINTQTASYTGVLSDAGKTIEMNVASANTFTVPQNNSIAYPVGTYLNVVQYGAGQCTITPDTSVTLRGRNGLKTAGQYAMVTLYKRATNEWVVGGDLTT